MKLTELTEGFEALEKQLLEKAVSRAKQKFMGMVYATKKGGKPASKDVAKVARGMSKKSAKDFAATKHTGKPEHVTDECAGVGIITKQNSTVDVNKNTPRKNLKAFKLI